MRMRVLFLIRSLEVGGAERQLVALANGLAARGHDVIVVTLYGGGRLENELRNITLHDAKKTGRWDILSCLKRLRSMIRACDPDVVHGYMGTANVFIALLKPFLGDVPIVWGIRASDMNLARYGMVAQLHGKLERLLSCKADCMIVNSEAGRRQCEDRGFHCNKIHVVHNGIDVEVFRPDREAGFAVRREWGIAADAFVVGIVARLDPMKGHGTFLQAACSVLRNRPDARFVCVGDGPDDYARILKRIASRLGLDQSLRWAGLRADMPCTMNAFDICVLSSDFGEGFPNVVGEAMACGVPCVATRVGDVETILGGTGKIVAPGDAESLCAALLSMASRLADDPALPREAPRERIVSHFGVARMVEATERILVQLVKQ
jgi:glycosyltransferase involved in cell wall biosynthesis